jgi:putative ABC transport system permease protein
VRLALGATGVQIAKTVVGHGLRVSAIGILIGTVLTVAAGRLLVQQAYKVSDLPWIFAAVATMLLILTLLACWVRRALTMDPVMPLRSE